MIRRYFALSVVSLVSAVLTASSASLSADNADYGEDGFSTGTRRELARSILGNPKISLLEYHVSGMRDTATALDNIVQTAAGSPAKRSYYGNGPGGTTKLSLQMLRVIDLLTREGHSFRITEVAGGSHSSRSRHYVGVAFDIDVLNGREIEWSHPGFRRFLKRCRELGATETLGPGTRGHGTHLHIAWPRPKKVED